MLSKLDKVIGCVVRAENQAAGVKIHYKDPFDRATRQLALSNGGTDLNDFDEFLEAVVIRYRIGALTRPELELLQCLVYGLCTQYFQAEGRNSAISLTQDIELAYQDVLKLSVWMRRLFSANQQNSAIISFDVNADGEVRLIYRRSGLRSMPDVFSYIGILLAQDHFDFDTFVGFCAATHSPLVSMDLHLAQSIHSLLCQNIRFFLNIGEGERTPTFKFNERKSQHVGSI